MQQWFLLIAGFVVVFSVQQIKFEFLGYIKGLGGEFSDWYIGAAANPEDALFIDHGVRREQDPWIYKPALTYKASQTILRYFREVLHTDGLDWHEVQDGATFAYAYKKSETTRPARRTHLVDPPLSET